jgi:cytochrome c biogenesis protein|tara:strand:+ start:9268 stop:10551 length:1284 start_codon:yes stop_codon:yes gene_type:complete
MNLNLVFFRYFAKLNLAITLLLLIAGFSILGTIIEQNQTIEYYKLNYIDTSNIFELNWKVILGSGLDHVYSTWWYLALLVLFGTCLLSCTFVQQLPTLKVARKTFFQTSTIQFKKQKFNSILRHTSFFKILKNLKQKNFIIFQQKLSIYSYKGILGRFAPIVVHISMLLILLGGVIAGLGGFNAQELIVKGEVFQIQNTINRNIFSKVPDYPIRVNDFWIEYGATSNVKQFYSDLSVLNLNGQELNRKTISVNFPLRYNELTFYQTDWNVIGIRLKIDDKLYQLPLTSFDKGKNLWITWIPSLTQNKDEGLIFICNNIEGSFTLYRSEGTPLGTFNLGEKINLLGSLEVIEYIPETGLQIKADPGIPLIYLGFGVLMISTLLSYLSYTQFWLAQIQDKLLIGGDTNRAKLNLKVTFLDLVLPYKQDS